VLSYCCFLSWRPCVTNSRTGTSGSSATSSSASSATMPHECKAGPCHGGSRAWPGKISLSGHWLTIKLAPSAQSGGKILQFESAPATAAAIASKQVQPTRNAHADRSARVDNRSSSRQHRTPWPRRLAGLGRRAAPQLHEPGGTGLVSPQPRPDHLRNQGRPARCWPESSSASSASSRTGRSASSSCLPNRYGYAIPAIAAPISGASQNTHSCAGAPLPFKNATPVERAGLTDVLEIRWIRVRVRPMARPANPLGAPVECQRSRISPGLRGCPSRNSSPAVT
jgi:hypothetical protein